MLRRLLGLFGGKDFEAKFHPRHESNASSRLLKLLQANFSIYDYALRVWALADDSKWNDPAVQENFFKKVD